MTNDDLIKRAREFDWTRDDARALARQLADALEAAVRERDEARASRDVWMELADHRAAQLALADSARTRLSQVEAERDAANAVVYAMTVGTERDIHVRLAAYQRVVDAAKAWRYGDDDYSGELLSNVCAAVDALDATTEPQ